MPDFKVNHGLKMWRGKEEMKQEKDERTHDMDRATDDVRCPFCGSFIVKINGFGYYRCKGSYKREFFIAFYNSLRTENPTKRNEQKWEY